MSRDLNDSSIVIIKYLSQNNKTSYNEITEKLNLSINTIKKSISKINELLLEMGNSKILVKQGLGVVFEGDLNDLKILIDCQYKRNIKPSDREISILQILLDTSEYMKIQDIADQLFLSRTTIENALSDIKPKIATQNLEYISNRNGIKINGPESVKRKELTKLLRHYLVGLTAVNDDKNYEIDLQIRSDSKLIVDEVLISKVSDVVNKFVKIEKLSITDYEYQSLTIHLAIAIERIKRGFLIHKQVTSLEKPEAESLTLANMIEEEFNIEFPDFEKRYLGIHVSAIKSKAQYNINFNDFDKLEYGNEIIEIIHKSLEGFNPDNDLIKSLLVHTNSAVKRLQMSASIKNPYKDQIRRTYIQAFNLSVTMAQKLEEKFNISINDDEISYLTLHIQAFFYRLKSHKKKVLVVCSSGYGTSKFLEQRIIKELKNTIDITRVIALDELMDTTIEEDLIISTIPIKNSFIPVVQVSPLFTESDLLEVTKYLGVKENIQYQRFVSLLDPRLFRVSNKKGDTHENVIEYIGNELIKQGYAKDGIIESALDRELLSSTAMNDFSLPHTQIEFVNSPKIFIYINKYGINWKEEQVKIVFFISLNEEVKKNLTDIYRFLNDIVDNHEVMDKLAKVKDFNELKDIIEEV